MSPEQANDEDIDCRSDLFTTGIILWELVAGRRMHRGTPQEKMDKSRQGDVPPLPEGRIIAQERLQSILDRALQKDRTMRYSNAEEFGADLRDYMKDADLYATSLTLRGFLEPLNEMRKNRLAIEQSLFGNPTGSLPPGSSSDSEKDPGSISTATEEANLEAPSETSGNADQEAIELPKSVYSKSGLWTVIGIAMAITAVALYLLLT